MTKKEYKYQEKENGKNDTGRPSILSDEQFKKVMEDFEQYINDKEDPTIVGFCSFYPKITSKYLGRDRYVNKDFISDRDEFTELRKRCIEKQEHYLLDGVTKNKLNATMGVFRLKQPYHGYKDKSEVDQNINMTAKVVNLPDRGQKKPIDNKE